MPSGPAFSTYNQTIYSNMSSISDSAVAWTTVESSKKASAKTTCKTSKPAPAAKVSQATELSRTFVDAKPSRKAAARTAAIPEAKNIDIREWSAELRMAPNTKVTVSICVGDASLKLPKPLLKDVSTNFEADLPHRYHPSL
jgi:hypothetical protein